MARVPRWAIALALTAGVKTFEIVWAMRTFYRPENFDLAITFASFSCVFLAGAIQRLNWRHALVMLGLTGAFMGLDFLKGYSGVPFSEGFHPYQWMVSITLMLCLLGMGEAFLTGRRSWRAAVWILIAAFAIEALRQVVSCTVNWTEWTWVFHPSPSSRLPLAVGTIIWYPVLGLLTWVGLPLALAALKGGRRTAIHAGALFAVALAIHTIFCQYLVFVFDKTSLQGRGPFSRDTGVRLLGDRGRPEDYDLILRALCEADWTVSGLDESHRQSWRETALQVLSPQDETARKAADALASLLRKKRCRNLAGETAKLMAAQRRLDVVPILLRYALEPGWGGACNEALGQMGIPEAGLHILMEAAAYDKPRTQSGDYAMSADHRKRLVALLGQDAGPNALSWGKAVDEAINNRQSHLLEPIQIECDREVAACMKYINTFNDWYEARGALTRQRLAAQGQIGQLKTVLDFQRKTGGGYVPEYAVPNDVYAAGEGVKAVFEGATADMKVEKPDYDAPTVELFEEQVAAYSARVDAVIEKYFPSPTTQSGVEETATQMAPAGAPTTVEANTP
jgi:hypothetical protein